MRATRRPSRPAQGVTPPALTKRTAPVYPNVGRLASVEQALKFRGNMEFFRGNMEFAVTAPCNDQTVSSTSRTVFLLTCRDPETDFRRPLAQELHSLGHEVFYIRLQRRPVVTRIGSDSTQTVSLPAFIAWMAIACRAARRPLIFNSTNLVLPGLTTVLKALCGGFGVSTCTTICFTTSGGSLVRAARAQRRKLASSDLIIHAGQMLLELFPQSHHLGNASDLPASERSRFDGSRVLVLSSLDQRFDFEFLDEVAQLNPSITFVIAGHISKGSEQADITATRLLQLTNVCRNVTYRGPYRDDDLVKLTAEFSISLAPYCTNSRLTRYIDPLRYYHCLNAGMEVVTTDIPQARVLADLLHIVREPTAFSKLVEGLASTPESRRNRGPSSHLTTWRERAERLIHIVEEHEGGAVRATVR